jgi:hypothetical protein
MKYLRKIYIQEIAHDELDLINLDDVFGISNDYHEHEEIVSVVGDRMHWIGEAEPINIDLLIKTLQELKDSGCNYVEVMFHCDHHGYNISGLKMREATKKEVENYEADKKIRIEAEKEKRRKQLEEELAKLKK